MSGSWSCRRTRLRWPGVSLSRRVLQWQMQWQMGRAMRKRRAHDAYVGDREAFRRGLRDRSA
jgi:hypothetical protein